MYFHSGYKMNLTKWEEHVNGIEGINAKTRKSMLLSPQTLLGLKITGRCESMQA